MSITSNVGLLTRRQIMALSGKYFNVTNPTAGTAIAAATITGFSATANGLFAIQNKNPANNGATIFVDCMRLIQTATAPTGTLNMRFETFVESGIVVMTGNVATRTPVNVNGGFPNTTGAVVQSFSAGQMTVPAAVGSRNLVGIGSIPTGLTVQHDSFVVEFGADGVVPSRTGLTAARATDPATMVTSMVPFVIPPQQTGWINMWWVTQAANVPSFEFSLNYVETN